VRPHMHQTPDKREVFIILRGSAAVVSFDNTGNITGSVKICREGDNYVVEMSPGEWHTIVSLEKNTVYYEVKDGPYNPANDKIFAPWAPEENTPEAKGYLACLKHNLGL